MNARPIHIVTALAMALKPIPALAEEATATRSIQAISLHEGRLDMVAYYVPARDGSFDVTATFAPRDLSAPQPMRVVMVLEDGDGATFAMPGYREILYTFRRDGDDVTATARRVEQPRYVSLELQAAAD